MEFDTVFIRRRDPTWAEIQEELEANRKHRASRAAIVRRYSPEDVALVGALRELNVDYFQHRADWRAMVECLWHRQPATHLTDRTLQFVRENFNVRVKQQRLLFGGLAAREEGRQLVDAVADASSQTRGVVKTVLDTLAVCVRRGLRKNRRVKVPGLGLFTVKVLPPRGPRQGRNPATGERVTLPARPERNRLKVRPARELGEFVVALPVRKRKRRLVRKLLKAKARKLLKTKKKQ